MFCLNTKCSGKIWLLKYSFQSLGRGDCQFPESASVCRVRKKFLKIKQMPFFDILPKGILFWRDYRINSRCFWRRLLSWQILFHHTELRISWRLCNNSEIHSWLWKVWSLVKCSHGSFHVTKAGKDDENTLNNFFLCFKKMNLLPDKQLFVNVWVQSTKDRKKELCMDNKISGKTADVYFPSCRTKKCRYIPTNKTFSFYECKTCKDCCYVLLFHSRTNNQHICCLAVLADMVMSKKSRDYKKGNASLFSKNFLRQSQSTTHQLEPKSQKPFHLSNNRVVFSLADRVNQKFTSSLILNFLRLQ